MKKLIFLLMLCKGCVAFGQADFKGTPYLGGGIFYGRCGIVKDTMKHFMHNRLDTIPCFMLCSDTSFTLDTLSKFPKVITLRMYTSKEIFWLHGYEVRKSVDSYLTVDENGNKIEEPFWSHKQYLDYDKHPLPKNVVVWLSK